MKTEELNTFGNLKARPLEENLASLKKISELKKEIEKLLKRNEENR